MFWDEHRKGTSPSAHQGGKAACLAASIVAMSIFLNRHQIGVRITGSYCFRDFASIKSFTIGTIVVIRFISVT